jgi:hypothetical protein
MKRKSILMIIVAVFSAGVAWGQAPPLAAWPTSLGTNVVTADTIYFCSTLDSLYPIELGYDIAGKSLSPKYGEWSLIALTEHASIHDYNFDTYTQSPKNEGAGNAFKVVGSGLGGYLFQYTAKDDQCGVGVDKNVWVYAFILPDPTTQDISKDSTICVSSSGSFSLDPNLYFREYVALYNNASIGIEKWAKGTITVPTDVVGTEVYYDTLILKPKTGYTCGERIPFQAKIMVIDTVGQLPSLSYTICPADTMGSKINVDPNDYFKRSYPGTYTPSTVGSNWLTKTVSGTPVSFKEFIFTYKECGSSTNKTVKDTLYVVGSQGNWGIDTVTACRTSQTESIFRFYDDPQIDYPNMIGKWNLTSTNSSWIDYGVSGTSANGIPVSPIVYGTVNGNTSLNGYNISVEELKSNFGYYYQWTSAGIECSYEKDPNTGILKPDSGVIVVIIQDPAIAQDYTAQLCQQSYTSNFDLNLYTGLDASIKWYPTKTDLTAGSNGVTTLNPSQYTKNTTHKFYYKLSTNCGSGGEGVFYVKFSNAVKVSGSKTVKYCVNKLPASINLNDILNVAVQDLKWELDASSTVSTINGFDENLGILNIGQYAKTSEETLVFKVKSGGDCGVADGTTVTLVFTDDITKP